MVTNPLIEIEVHTLLRERCTPLVEWGTDLADWKWGQPNCLYYFLAESTSSEKCLEKKHDVLMFDKFDIIHVLKHGEALLGSSGQEYDVFDEELLGKAIRWKF